MVYEESNEKGYTKKEAMFYESLENGSVRCRLCPHNCIIKEGMVGICSVRKNISGKLYSLFYGKASAFAVDPIEKKPLFHFFPGKSVLSFSTVGCNLRCLHCQNWDISQEWSSKDKKLFYGGMEYRELSPKDIVDIALENNIPIIAATYTEPTIFYEYMYDTFRLAKEKGIKTVMVSNGYINREPLLKLIPYLDGANIDLKAFSDEFYIKVTKSRLNPVLESIKLLNEKKVWLEVTNLVIPKYNDRDFEKISKWLYSVDKDIPLHFTAFRPMYKLTDTYETPVSMLEDAYKIAKKVGLSYVYLGNVISDKENTYCPKCGNILIERKGYSLGMVKTKCECGYELKGVF